MNITQDDGLIEAKTRLANANADKVELQVRAMRGELLEREVVNKKWNEKANIVKNKLLGLPELAPMLFDRGSIQAVKKLLKDKVYEILSELAEEIDSEW